MPELGAAGEEAVSLDDGVTKELPQFVNFLLPILMGAPVISFRLPLSPLLITATEHGGWNVRAQCEVEATVAHPRLSSRGEPISLSEKPLPIAGGFVSLGPARIESCQLRTSAGRATTGKLIIHS